MESAGEGGVLAVDKNDELPAASVVSLLTDLVTLCVSPQLLLAEVPGVRPYVGDAEYATAHECK
jgi:hypothetical protein